MKTYAHTILLASCLAINLAACEANQPANDAVNNKPSDVAIAAPTSTAKTETQATKEPIPGPRNCFWSRGPHSGDPYINLAYPDANVFYWAAVFSVPDGAALTLNGDFAHARYQSLISYDERGRPIESVADYLMKAEPASTNPFRAGQDRYTERRRYAIAISSDAPLAGQTIGVYQSHDSSNVLHTPPYKNGQQLIIYRIYLPDAGTAPTGGVALPTPVLKLIDGRTVSGDAACAALNTTQPLQISRDAAGIPAKDYRKLLNMPGKPDTWPAKIPAEWFIQLDRPSLLGIYTGEISEQARRSEGGFYPNLDNHYIRTIVNRKHGKVFMVRGKMPVTPKTYNATGTSTDGELRYWSICSNQGFANTRVNDCLFDEEIPLDKNRFYTVMISRSADRPRNAIIECGIAWLPMADDGDGMFDDDVTVVQIRNMLTSPEFKHSVQRVEQQKDLESIMGPYMPKTAYLQPNQVETFFPCLLD